MFHSQHSSHIDSRASSPFNMTANRLATNPLNSQTDLPRADIMKPGVNSRGVDSKYYVKIDLGEERASL